MNAINIKWDTDGDMEIFNSLPTEIEIPEDVIERANTNDDAISDYLSV